ncbi:hypothetical protein [Nocardia panacis]|nr:hypothetical protein [Nocardia panacis]
MPTPEDPRVCLAAADADELARLLRFIDRWLVDAGPIVERSLVKSSNTLDYMVDDLRADLAWFVCQLEGGDPGERL